MEHIILIRIGEIFLKGHNRNFFISLLKNNICEAAANEKQRCFNERLYDSVSYMTIRLFFIAKDIIKTKRKRLFQD